MNTTVGTCSICGGPVTVPSVWMATVPPVPTCSQCGAQAKGIHGPVIDMAPTRGVSYSHNTKSLYEPRKIK